MIIGTNICGVITITCDIDIINVTFYLLKVLHTHLKKKKKSVSIVELSKKLKMDTL